MYILWWIIVGLIAGWLTGKLMKGSGYGAMMDIVVGIIGAVIGGWIMRAVGFAGERRHDLYHHRRGDWRGHPDAYHPPGHRAAHRRLNQVAAVSRGCIGSSFN